MVLLTGDKFCSLLEAGKDEVGHDVKACKQEYTDLHKTQKDITFERHSTEKGKTFQMPCCGLSYTVQLIFPRFKPNAVNAFETLMPTLSTRGTNKQKNKNKQVPLL